MYGVAVGSKTGRVGTTNVDVFFGGDVVMDCNSRRTTVGADVTEMFSGMVLTQPVKPPTNVTAYISALNLSLVCMLINQLYSNIVSELIYVLSLIFLLW